MMGIVRVIMGGNGGIRGLWGLRLCCRYLVGLSILV